jgi:seryl-tRNA synthetase
MSEQIQLSQEELDNIKQLQATQQNLISRFGQVEYQLQVLEAQKDELVTSLARLREEEVNLGKSLTEKYGNGSIDLESGLFTKT